MEKFEIVILGPVGIIAFFICFWVLDNLYDVIGTFVYLFFRDRGFHQLFAVIIGTICALSVVYVAFNFLLPVKFI